MPEYNNQQSPSTRINDQLSLPLKPVTELASNGNNHQSNNVNNPPANGKQDQQQEQEQKQQPELVTVASIIGEYGLYQLSLTILAFVRYVCVAMMTNTGPLLAPSLDYRCQVPSSLVHELAKNGSTPLDSYLLNRCQLELKNGRTYECVSWTYNTSETGTTLTDTYDLVCDRDWLRSAFQSSISFGVIVASVILGLVSDKYGRKFTINACLIGSILCGIISYAASNFIIYTVSRMLCSFCDLGLVVSLTTIIVETLGNKYRGTVCIIVYTGWAFGVMVMPWITEHFKNFRHVMLFTVCCHVFTLPWIMTTSESVRWLLVNGRIDEAHEELKRINRWNGRGEKSSLGEADRKFDLLKGKFVVMAERRKLAAFQAADKETVTTSKRRLSSSIFSGFTMANKLFQSKELAATTLTVIWTGFNTELLYMLFILINSDVGENVKLNYLIGGAMETLATLQSILIVSRVSRRVSVSATLATVSVCCFLLAFTHQMAGVSTWMLNLTKLAISTLSSIIYVVTTEVFPTNLRQTGFGVCGTIGGLGAVIAPFIRTELVDLIGMTRVLLIVTILPLTAAITIPFFLRETRGVELPDDIDDIEETEEGVLRPRASSFTMQHNI